ncbi:hypothetical protein [Algibacter mikhailovii]|uniref:Uncharacterized protein n=1 Tax=Algibacter mikhailovii TaxID=425498 RepID=A0A918QX84_9FLAO|nr:hypothetical protein [Algibacter mikhailovii]GGZ75033.1 hypothetical protein GCM10007028_10560 [Algibacter mikhailovii]
MNLKAKIPSIYHAISPEVLDIEIPAETIATCDACNHCRSPQSPRINTKCCDYHPNLPNFLIGYILTDEDESYELGRHRIRDQIKAQAGVTPYGTVPPVPYYQRRIKESNHFVSSGSHELRESLLCPYYDQGRCTVYKYRNSTCVTFYCSSIGGVAGKSFWNKVKTYLELAETTLSQYAMQQLGWPPAQIKTYTVGTMDFNVEDKKGNINKENYGKLWGGWAGREEEFYIKCYEIVSKVDAHTFKQITGLKHEILEVAISDTQKNFIKNMLPEKLVLHPNVNSEKAEEGYTLMSLGEETAKIPLLILPLIRSFNGKRTTLEVYQLGFDVLYNMEEVVDELRKKGMLINV